MSNDLEKKETQEIVLFEPENATQAAKLAGWLSKSSLIPDTLRGKPADILVILITAHELGISPMQAVRGINVIKGRPVLSADLMVAMVVKNREVCEYFRLVESSTKFAAYEAKRKGSEPVSLTYTIEEAKAAGLTSNAVWTKHTAAMLRARCSSALARAVFPDLVMGIYTPDESQEFGGRDVEPIPIAVDVLDARKVLSPDAIEGSEEYERQMMVEPPKKKCGRPRKKTADAIKEKLSAAENDIPTVEEVEAELTESADIDKAAEDSGLFHPQD